eukprot:COSAG06_NODE_36989_length_440_cov_3.357771_1_plen_139_part_10
MSYDLRPRVHKPARRDPLLMACHDALPPEILRHILLMCMLLLRALLLEIRVGCWILCEHAEDLRNVAPPLLLLIRTCAYAHTVYDIHSRVNQFPARLLPAELPAVFRRRRECHVGAEMRAAAPHRALSHVRPPGLTELQ